MTRAAALLQIIKHNLSGTKKRTMIAPVLIWIDQAVGENAPDYIFLWKTKNNTFTVWSSQIHQRNSRKKTPLASYRVFCEYFLLKGGSTFSTCKETILIFIADWLTILLSKKIQQKDFSKKSNTLVAPMKIAIFGWFGVSVNLRFVWVLSHNRIAFYKIFNNIFHIKL